MDPKFQPAPSPERKKEYSRRLGLVEGEKLEVRFCDLGVRIVSPGDYRHLIQKVWLLKLGG